MLNLSHFIVCFRALELSIKHKKFLNIIIYERRNYLEFYKKQETNEKFLKYFDVRYMCTVNW